MKQLTYLVILSGILSLSPLFAQDNFIEVTGKAKKMLKAENITYSLEVQLIQNSYDYDYDYDYDTYEENYDDPVEEEDYSYEPEPEPDPKQLKTEAISKLSKKLGLKPEDFKNNKGLFNKGLYGGGENITFLVTVKGDQKKEIEKALDTITDPTFQNWTIFKSEISDKTREEAEKELLKKAIQKTRAKAEYIAEAENKTLGGITSIQESPLAQDMISQMYGSNFKNIFDGLLGGASEEGMVEVSVDVRVKYRID